MLTYTTRLWLILLIGSFGALTSTTTGQGKRTESPTSSIDSGRLMAHVKQLASDDFEGRAPGTAGEVRTLDYIIRQLAAAGVAPGGDPTPGGGRSWTQDVPLAQSDINGSVTAVVKSDAGSRSLRQGEDVAFRATHLPTTRVVIKSAPLVFVGYGTDAPERKWDDFKDVDLRGKIGIVLVNDPDFEVDMRGRFGGKAMTALWPMDLQVRGGCTTWCARNAGCSRNCTGYIRVGDGQKLVYGHDV